jgi:hypothetical protein
MVVAVLAELWWFKVERGKMKKKLENIGDRCKIRQCGIKSGSGWLGVVAFDRGDQCGSNGGGWRVVVAVLAKLRSFKVERGK